MKKEKYYSNEDILNLKKEGYTIEEIVEITDYKVAVIRRKLNQIGQGPGREELDEMLNEILNEIFNRDNLILKQLTDKKLYYEEHLLQTGLEPVLTKYKKICKKLDMLNNC